ncbi:META domain-containing protein [Rhodococcus sp. NPDC058505]|uniref:META domain-containing protein n=1 Tax=unclassified Rhodococcus (in: high G+C Gram-positive bacteria) TaxID=192944 RepID=UPI003655E6A9
MRTLRLAGLIALTAALAACSDSSTASPESPQADLLGRTFVSTTVDGTPIPGGGPLTVEFVEPDRLAATAGCNRATGTADFSGGTITAGALATTMMACVGDVGESDAWLTEFFTANPQWSLDGDTLHLRTGAADVTLLDKKVAQPDRPLTGTTWVVDSTISPTAVTASRAIEESAPSLQIGDDGAVTGSTGCNTFTGTAQVADDSVTFGPLATTRKMCPPDVAEVERAVLSALDGATTVTIDADRMRLMNDNGTGLGLRAR